VEASTKIRRIGHREEPPKRVDSTRGQVFDRADERPATATSLGGMTLENVLTEATSSSEQRFQGDNACLICGQQLTQIGARAIDRLVTGEGPFEVLHCPACNFGVTLPRMTDDELARYYSSTYYEAFCEWADGGGGSLLVRARSRWRRFSARRRARRKPFAPLPVTPGRVLDVGCGDGGLLENFADAPWQPVGLDPSKTAVEATRRRGIEAFQGTLDDHPWAYGSFQAVLFQHSLEHIPDPMASLSEAARLLAPGGVVVVAVPNWASWQRRLFGSFWSHLELPRHNQFFSPKALRRSAERMHLEAIEVGTESNVISPVYSLHYLLAGRWTYGWKLWAAYALGAAVYPLLWLVDRVGGGDCCYLVARRPVAV
jgi:SAM-dependent methyltransferase